jgi:hypothetical protein
VLTRPVLDGLPPLATARTASGPDQPSDRHLPGPRIARVLVQAFCLGAVALVPGASMSGLQALVLAQCLAAAGIYLVLRSTGTTGNALRGTLRIWGIGALVSLVTLTWLGDVVPHDLRLAQLCAIGVLVALAGLGRMRDAFRDAGRQIDAILATLPPPADAERLDTRKAW